jgi:hypothetical protein
LSCNWEACKHCQRSRGIPANASTTEERMYRYRELFRTGVDARDVHDVRRASMFSVPLENNLFKERIEAILGKSVGYIARGRPKQG